MEVFLAGVFALLIGSFLNVVIARLPKILFTQWTDECNDFLGIDIPQASNDDTFNLCWPGSHCPDCKHKINWHDNIPIISFLWLKGKCRNCKNSIPLKYPLVEALACITTMVIVFMHGITTESSLMCLLSYILIAQSFIDYEHQIIPDELTMPTLWLGLLVNTQGGFVSLHDAVIGAAAGYFTLWAFYQVFKIFTGKEGLGYGDFKLLAMFGAWFGYQVLPAIIIISSCVGAIFGIGMIAFCGYDKTKPIPFGPYLAIAGWIAMLWGPIINNWYLNFIGY